MNTQGDKLCQQVDPNVDAYTVCHNSQVRLPFCLIIRYIKVYIGSPHHD